MRISDWSSDVCSSDLFDDEQRPLDPAHLAQRGGKIVLARIGGELAQDAARRDLSSAHGGGAAEQIGPVGNDQRLTRLAAHQRAQFARRRGRRSEEHTSELQSLMRISYAVFCLKKK